MDALDATLLDRARAAGRSQRRRLAVVERDGERCAECGTTERLTLDHIVPRARGGTDGIENRMLLCLPCNQAKGDELDPGTISDSRLRPKFRPKPLAKLTRERP